MNGRTAKRLRREAVAQADPGVKTALTVRHERRLVPIGLGKKKRHVPQLVPIRLEYPQGSWIRIYRDMKKRRAA